MRTYHLDHLLGVCPDSRFGDFAADTLDGVTCEWCYEQGGDFATVRGVVEFPRWRAKYDQLLRLPRCGQCGWRSDAIVSGVCGDSLACARRRLILDGIRETAEGKEHGGL